MVKDGVLEKEPKVDQVVRLSYTQFNLRTRS